MFEEEVDFAKWQNLTERPHKENWLCLSWERLVKKQGANFFSPINSPRSIQKFSARIRETLSMC